MAFVLEILNIVVFLVVLGLALLVILRRCQSPPVVIKIVVLGFGARLGYAIVDNHLRVLAGRYDFFAYNDWILAFAQHVQTASFGELVALLSTQTFLPVYGGVFGPIYIVFGKQEVLVRMAMAFFGALLVFNLYRLGDLISTHRAGVYAAGVGAVFPYWIYLSGLFYRDMFVVFVLSQVVYEILRWTRRDEIVAAPLGFAVVWILLSIPLRFENLVPIGALCAVAFYFKLEQSFGTPIAVGSSASIVFGALLLLRSFGQGISVRYLEAHRRYLARGTAKYLTSLYSNWVELILFLPVSTLYFLFVPFPWQVQTLPGLIALLQNVVLWYPIFVLSLDGIRTQLSTEFRDTVVLLAFVVAGITSYGVLEANVGPALRHRTQFQFLLVVFASVAITNRLPAYWVVPDDATVGIHRS